MTQNLDRDLEVLKNYFDSALIDSPIPSPCQENSPTPPEVELTLSFPATQYEQQFNLGREPFLEFEDTLLESRSPVENLLEQAVRAQVIDSDTDNDIEMPASTSMISPRAMHVDDGDLAKLCSSPLASPVKRNNGGDLLGAVSQKRPAWSPRGLDAAFGLPSAMPAVAPLPVFANAASASAAATSGAPDQSEVLNMLRSLVASQTSFQESIKTSVTQTHDDMMALKSRVDTGLQLCRDELREGIKSSDNKLAALEVQFAALRATIKIETTADLLEEMKKHKATASAFVALPHLPSGPASSTDRNIPWIANKIFLKGWCAYGSDAEALSSENAEAIGASIISKLPLHLFSKIAKVSAPYFKNRQITLHLKENLEKNEPWDICSGIRSAIVAHNLNLGGKTLIASLDAPPWKR